MKPLPPHIDWWNSILYIKTVPQLDNTLYTITCEIQSNKFLFNNEVFFDYQRRTD